jgi:hypothetical protein
MDLPTVAASLSLGLGLAAACGFRVFIPPLMIGVASRAGYYELEGSYTWVSEDWAIAVFTLATLLELGAYYVPWIDNLLDVVATPSAILAGIFVTSASLEGMDSSLQWFLAIIAGGGVAGTIQLGTVATRVISTTTTGGLANPIVSTLEAIACVVCVILSLFLAVIIPIVIIFLVWKATTYILKRDKTDHSN